MREKVTTEIDSSLKKMFEACKDSDRPTYKQMLEEKIIEYLEKHDPIRALEAENQRMDQVIQENRDKLAKLRTLSK